MIIETSTAIIITGILVFLTGLCTGLAVADILGWRVQRQAGKRVTARMLSDEELRLRNMAQFGAPGDTL